MEIPVQTFSVISVTLVLLFGVMVQGQEVSVCIGTNGQTYYIGDAVPTSDNCSSCECSESGSVVCLGTPCVLHCAQQLVEQVEGECCPRCKPGCVDTEGTVYQVGDEINTNDPCESCECSETDGIMCAVTSCPVCEGTLIPPSADQCCGECREKECVKNGITYQPGPIGDRCDGCFCRNGRIRCKPPVCPKARLACVDPKIGKDCCPMCPNAASMCKTCRPTCAAHNKVIKAGDFVQINRRTVCTCLEDYWFPNAFCARRRIMASLRSMATEMGITFARKRFQKSMPLKDLKVRY